MNKIAWQKIYKTWRRNEDNDTWRKHYKIRGYASWSKWRDIYIQPLGLKDLKWQISQIKDLKQILDFYGGPFKAWKKYFYKNKNTLKFKDLIKLKKIQDNKKIQAIQKKLPKKIILIALQKKNKIYIIEGMHRCCALSLKIKKAKKINSKIFIVVAKYNKNKLPILG